MTDVISISNILDDIPFSLQVIAASLAIVFLAGVYSLLIAQRPIAGFPVLTVEGLKPKASWTKRGNETLEEGYKTYAGKAFQVVTGTGPRITIPNRLVNEVKSDPRFSIAGAFAADFFVHYPGFQAVKVVFEHDSNKLIQETVRIRLTQSLGLITADLVEEATDAIHDIYGEDDEWKTIKVKRDVVELVARMSSRTFLGKPLCRNREWLDVTSRYSVGVFVAARDLRALPAFARPMMQYFTPSCTEIRTQYKIAQRLINDEVQKRTAAAQQALAEGRKPAKTADAIGWMVDLAKGQPYDLGAGQLALSVAAIQTTNEAMCQVLMDICDHHEIVQPLRDEIIQVIGEHGWSKTALYQLKLMDSVLKESMRMHRPRAALNRYAMEDVVLSDGTKIPKHSRVQVEARFFDPVLFPNPEKFDPYRFMNLRENQELGQGKDWQFVSVNPEFMGFGLGPHACPGRFFVTNEIKIALCHLLLKYDWRIVPGQEPARSTEVEAAFLFPPSAELQIKRRQEEVDLSKV